MVLIVKGGWQMRYFSVAEMAKKWDASERSARNYALTGVYREHLLPERHGTFRKMQKPERSNKKKEKDDAIGYFAG